MFHHFHLRGDSYVAINGLFFYYRNGRLIASAIYNQFPLLFKDQ